MMMGGEPRCPVDDAERRKLLDRISAEGGFAYVAVADLAAAGDLRAAEAAREMAWEQLHSGPWHSVLSVWRDAYAMACLSVAGFHLAAGEPREALRVLDMGLIMGGLLLRKDLESAVDRILQSSCPAAEAAAEEEGPGRRRNGGIDAADDLAQVLPILPSKSLSCGIVERKSSLSLERFLADYYLVNRPVIVTDCISHWPALTKWKDINYLKRVAGDRTVPVEVGKNYLSPEWKQELITFSQFLERIGSTDCNSSGLTYLAQHPLFDQIHELHKDILIPDYCFAGGGELQSLNAWFGPSGTVTPLHHDPHHNLFAQVVGHKYIRLYADSAQEEMYPHTEPMLFNSSQRKRWWLPRVLLLYTTSNIFHFWASSNVDLDNLDEKAFPRVCDLEFVDCILKEGEMLYIPPKWWHYVRSLSTSFSVSFWWSDGSGHVS